MHLKKICSQHFYFPFKGLNYFRLRKREDREGIFLSDFILPAKHEEAVMKATGTRLPVLA